MSALKPAEIWNKQHHRLIRIKDVMHLTGLSRSCLYAIAGEGKFPRSVSLVHDGASKGWVEAEVQAWIQQRIQERDQETGNE
jgi:prophage regulatory protein